MDSYGKEYARGWIVELYVYDISHGMARTMSMQFLGKQIDAVYHTGIVVYGSEYFYGGGIQSAAAGMTVAGRPMKIIPLGFTQIPQSTFHAFLDEVSPQFTPDKYNLIRHNCNNFSDAISNFLLGKPIPTYITGLPEEALNTPMGRAFLPMIENMQNNMIASTIPGFNSNNFKPVLPSVRALYEGDAPLAKSEDVARVEKANKEEEERVRQKAGTSHAKATSIVQKQSPKPKSKGPGVGFKVFNPNPPPKLTLDKNLAAYCKKLSKQFPGNALLLQEIVSICQNNSGNLNEKHWDCIMNMIFCTPANKLLIILSFFRFMTARLEAATYFSTRLTILKKFFSHLGLVGNGKKPLAHIIQLGLVSISHLYANEFPVDEEIVNVILEIFEKYSNTVSLSAMRTLFNLVLNMEPEMDDIQCQICSSLISNIYSMKHISTRRRGLWVLCFLFQHMEDARDLAMALDFDTAVLKELEGNMKEDFDLISDLEKILSSNNV